MFFALVLMALLSANIAAGVAAVHEGRRLYFALKEVAAIAAVGKRAKSLLTGILEWLMLFLGFPVALAFVFFFAARLFCLVAKIAASDWALFPGWFRGQGEKKEGE